MRLIDLKEISKILNIKQSTIRNLVFKKELNPYRIGRLLRFDIDEIMDNLKKERDTNFDQAVKALPLLEDMEFSQRARNCFFRENILTTEELLKKTDYDLRRVKNLGDKTRKEIDEVLEMFNLIRKKF